jgi:hypothetical protein
MATGMFLIQDDGKLVEMEERPYPTEDLLQELLAKYPNLLAGNQIDIEKPRKWLLVSREAALPSEENGSDRWSVDHLFLDQDAVPTLVEVKRSSDTRIRREVVGQMLDYAANAVVYWPVEEIKAKFEATCNAEGNDPAEKLREFLGDAGDWDAFWDKAKTNLQAGKVRMLFVADKIPAELRRIVEFLNEQMDPAEVLAVEIKHYAGQGWKSLIPRVIGQTEEATAKKNPSAAAGKQWDEESFFQDLASRKGTEDVQIARKILEWAKQKMPRLWWGKGKQDGSFIPIMDHNNISYYPIAVWTYGKVEIQFQWLQKRPPFNEEAKRKQLLDLLNQIPGVNIPENAITRRPNIPLSVFKNEAALNQFLGILEWIIKEILAS